MEASIKINSISIDLANAADEIDSGKCEHFSIRGYVAEIRERDHGKCWPFSEDTVELGDQSYSLPPLSVLKSRWWRCASCIRDINGKEMNDSDCRRLQSRSRSIKEKNLNLGSSAIPSGRKLNSLTVADKKANKNHVQTATLLKKVRRRAKEASTIKSRSKLASPEQVSKRSKEKANISAEISWKESREVVNGGETMEAAVTAFGSSEIAGVVEDTPDKAIKKSDRYSHVSAGRDESDINVSPESRNPLGLHRRKTRKVRLLSELLSNKNNETLSKRESVRGRKRKSCGDEEHRSAEMTNYASRILSTMGKTSDNASKSCDSEGNTVSGEEPRPSVESQSTDSGFDKEPIKGKQRNSRFQVVEAETAQMDPYDYASPAHASFPGKELVPCPLHTQRKEKELTLAKKRKRKGITDNTKSTIINFSNNMDDGHLVKARKPDNFQQACPRDVMPQSTRDFLNSKWLDSSFDKLPGSYGHFTKYTPQLDNRPVFPLPLQDKMHYKDGDGAMMNGVGTNHFPDFGSSFRSTNADGCLRTGVNVNFSSNRDTITSSSLNDKLRHISSTEVAYSPCALQKDISTAHGKGKEGVVQELSAAPRIQSKTSEHLDDIPMEIVELMAKNQYERCLPDSEEDKQPSQVTTSVSKNALLIDLNETYDNSMDNNTTRQAKPPGKNARNSNAATKEGQFMAGKQNSLDFFPTSYNVPFGVGNSPLTRGNQSSSIQFSGVVRPNSQWISNVPTTMANQQNPFRVLRACNTCQNVQQQQDAEASRPVWISSIPAHKPVSLNMQKFMDQSTRPDTPNTRNLNFTDNGKQKLGFEGVSSRSMDTYSNESSIPAMHLLSLMDPRLRSNIPADQSRNTSFAKCPFSPVHQSKEFIGPQPGDCSKTAYSTKQWPFDLYSKRVLTPETSRENLAIIPPLGTSSISFQSEKTSVENADLRFQASWKHHQEKNSNRKDNNFTPVYNSHHQKPVFPSSSSDSGKFQLLGASDSMMLPLKFHMKDNAKKHKSKKAQSHNAVSACPPSSTGGRFLCSINRNPADFTIPGAPGNVYMIKGEDLKVRKHPGFRKKSSMCKQDALIQNKTSNAPDAENA